MYNILYMYNLEDPSNLKDFFLYLSCKQFLFPMQNNVFVAKGQKIQYLPDAIQLLVYTTPTLALYPNTDTQTDNFFDTDNDKLKIYSF